MLRIIFATLLLSTAARATEKTRVELEKELDNLNSIYSSIDAYCNNRNHHADLNAECKSKKIDIQKEYGQRVQYIIDRFAKQ